MAFVLLFGIAVAAFIMLVYPLLGRGSPEKGKGICLLLIVQNLEECIEGIMREILWRSSLMGQRLELLVIDRGSTDDTRAILSRFAHPYPACTVILSPDGRPDWEPPEVVGGGGRVVLWDLTGQPCCHGKEVGYHFRQLLDKNISSASRETGG
ncbi:glycosyltransferase [Thermanaeromonas sp. C210]|uniref:glycosyltransferase n=1 Tax=Thermanaeromonas sp. C210 TaxID=2731925 RepID=UPI00155D0F32|nr:glycosyltransferase [Thermanaeromonas sp. C210]GFN22758.1 hypothetical protein TAMC210_10750 [Thermanaeromonas sp. C210]